MKPAKHQHTVLKQICQQIPAHLVPKLARTFGADKKARTLCAFLLFAFLSHPQP